MFFFFFFFKEMLISSVVQHIFNLYAASACFYQAVLVINEQELSSFPLVPHDALC